LISQLSQQVLAGIGFEKLVEEINPSEGKQIDQVKSPKLDEVGTRCGGTV
jgi:hypothetical protein